VYAFYKKSGKRKIGLENAAKAALERSEKEKREKLLSIQSEVENLGTTMEKSVEDGNIHRKPRLTYEGEQWLVKLPSLRLKKWNPTRWLGRADCFVVLCRTYPFVLDHLRIEMADKSSDKDHQKKVTDLYQRLTDYDTFLFIHFYRDLTQRMSFTSKQLQSKDLEVSHIARHIRTLSKRLKRHYPSNCDYPADLLGDGHTDNLIRELFAMTPEDTMDSTTILLYITYEIRNVGF